MYQVRLHNLYNQDNPNTFRVLVVKFVKRTVPMYSLSDALAFAKGEKIAVVNEDQFRQLADFFGPILQYRVDEWQNC